MNADEKVKSNLIHLESINQLKAIIDNPRSDKATSGITFTLHTKQNIDTQSKRIRISLWVDIQGIDDAQNPTSFHSVFEYEFIYLIDNLDELIVTRNDASQIYTLNALLGYTILGTSYSTMRGIVYTRLEGTLLHSFILPVVGAKELFGDTIEVKIKS